MFLVNLKTGYRMPLHYLLKNQKNFVQPQRSYVEGNFSLKIFLFCSYLY